MPSFRARPAGSGRLPAIRLRTAAALLAGVLASACTADSVMRPIPEVDVGTQTSAIVSPYPALRAPPRPLPQAAAPMPQALPEVEPAFVAMPSASPAFEPEAPAGPQLEEPEPALLPAARPRPILAAMPRVAPPLLQPEPAIPGNEAALRRELKRLGVRYVDLPPIDGGGGCRIDYPVKVTGLAGGIELKPAATLNATMAVTFARYVRSDFAPAVRWRYFSGIRTIYTGSTYACRNMIGESTNHLSEHAKGNAIDVMKIALTSGRVIDVEKPGLFSFRQRGFLDRVRGEACGYFTTVLGPGYNRAHADHFHFDLKQRRNGYVACR